jgi:hypothetical protein
MPFPVDCSFVTAAEEQLGVRFPESYVLSMCASNGGNTPDDRWILHPIYDSSDRKRMKRTSNHVVRETQAKREYDNFPPGGVVIGENLEGGLLLLLPDESDPSRLSEVVYWWHPFHGNLDVVARDFADWSL